MTYIRARMRVVCPRHVTSVNFFIFQIGTTIVQIYNNVEGNNTVHLEFDKMERSAYAKRVGTKLLEWLESNI